MVYFSALTAFGVTFTLKHSIPFPFSMNINYYALKHRVKMKIPLKIRLATICRRCNPKKIQNMCLTCKIEQARHWTKPY